VIENLQERAAQVPGVKLYLQPVQDLTIDTETGLTPIASRSRARTRMRSMNGATSWPARCRTNRRCAM
jgi:hypothetical protein